MTPENIDIFNHNVRVTNHNTELFENITNSLIRQNDMIIDILGNYNGVDIVRTMVMFIIFSLFVLELKKLENKVKILERGDKVDKHRDKVDKY